jgi:hypothetical protein
VEVLIVASVLMLNLLFTSRAFRRALGCMTLSLLLMAVLILVASQLAAHP